MNRWNQCRMHVVVFAAISSLLLWHSATASSGECELNVNQQVLGNGSFSSLRAQDQTALIELSSHYPQGYGLRSEYCSGWDSDGACASNCISCNASADAAGELYVVFVIMEGAPMIQLPFPEALCNLTQLTGLFATSVNLTGPLPDCVGEMFSLRYAFLASNKLSGSFNPALCQLAQLEFLYLEDNLLEGTLPDCIGNMKNLERFQIGHNKFSGDIPWEAALCGLNNMRILRLHSNGFNPSQFPVCLCATPKLKRLDLGQIQLTGGIPSCISNLSDSLVNLTLSHNLLREEIPLEICKLRYLSGLYLENNLYLEGAIPGCIGEMTSLQQVSFLNTPSLRGVVPSSLFTLPKLEYLLISMAQLEGTLPQGDRYKCPNGICPNISIYNPDKECYYAPEPINGTEDGTMPWLPELQLMAIVGCRLEGEIPAWLGTLPKANTIVLSGNSFRGDIPTFPVESQLMQFHAADNELTGTLYPVIYLTKLMQLDVGHNKITGIVPKELGERSANMHTIIIEDNRLSCELPKDLTISQNDSEFAGYELIPPKMHLLRNNLFACPLPKNLKNLDPGAAVYKCGSAGLTFALTVFGSVFCVVVVATLATWKLTMWLPKDVSIRPNLGAAGADLKMIRASAVVAAMWVMGLMPTYLTAPSILECRFGWRATAAFLVNLEESPVAWVYVLLIIGGLGGGAVCTWLLTIPALKYINEHKLHFLHTNVKLLSIEKPIDLYKPPSGKFGIGRGAPSVRKLKSLQQPLQKTRIKAPPGTEFQWIGAVTIAAIWVCVNTAVNIGYLYLQERNRSGTIAKHFLVIMYGATHEGIIHLILPWTIWHIIQRFPMRRRTPATVHSLTLALGLITSVVAPLVALVFGTEGCLPELVPLDKSVGSTVIVRRSYCQSYSFQTGECVVHGFIPTEISYTQPFEWNGGRCISSIITLYTPAYVMVFSVRLLLLAFLYWTRNFHPSIITLGLLKKDDMFMTNIKEGESQEEFEARKRKQQWASAQFLTWASTFGLNCISISMCAGMASPIISVCSFVCLVARPIIFYTLDRLRVNGCRLKSDSMDIQPAYFNPVYDAGFASEQVKLDPHGDKLGGNNRNTIYFGGDEFAADSGGLLDDMLMRIYYPDNEDDQLEDEDEQEDSKNDISYAEGSDEKLPEDATKRKAPKVDPFALPLVSISLILLFQSVYVLTFLYAGGFAWGGLIVVALNWMVFLGMIRDHFEIL